MLTVAVSPEATPARETRVVLWIAVIAQALANIMVTAVYAGALFDPDRFFVRRALMFPKSAEWTAALLAVGAFATALTCIAMLRRAAWAPLPYVVWLCVAATENIFHKVELLSFPFLAFPLVVCVYFCARAHREARERGEPGRGRLGGPLALGLLGLWPPFGAALGPFVIFSGLFSRSGAGFAVAALGLLGVAGSATFYVLAAQAAFAAPL